MERGYKESLGLVTIAILLFIQCKNEESKIELNKSINKAPAIELVVLGTIQDAGAPHIGCRKKCCENLRKNNNFSNKVVSLGIVDRIKKRRYLIEASPDMPDQLNQINKKEGLVKSNKIIDGIFLTHAHIGHYAGLMFLGREALNANKIPVYAMPKMKTYLETSGPWSQLVKIDNIELISLGNNEPAFLQPELSVTPFFVPHRDEYSETVGFKIKGPQKTILFIPDIDKWEKWSKDIVEEIKKVDIAFLDATFYDGYEINNRDISEIPHPFVIESFKIFDTLSQVEKSKVYFIHLNHTNPLIDPMSSESKIVREKGFNVAEEGMSFSL